MFLSGVLGSAAEHHSGDPLAEGSGSPHRESQRKEETVGKTHLHSPRAPLPPLRPQLQQFLLPPGNPFSFDLLYQGG